MAVTINGSTGIEYDDNVKHVLGTGDDLEIYHNGSDSYIAEIGTGSLKVLSHDYQLKNAANDEMMIRAMENDAVELYHNNVKKLWTESWGINIDGNLALGDSEQLIFGGSDDFKIYHDGSDAFIDKTTTDGRLQIKGDGIQLKSGNNNFIHCDESGVVEITHSGNKKFETISTGVNITGGIRLGGNNAVNELDDYETGTFTPRLGGVTNAGSYSVNGIGTYVKIGEWCHMTIAFNDIDLNNSAAGAVKIDTLPFTSKNETINSSGIIAGCNCNFQTEKVGFDPNKRQTFYMSGNATEMKGLESADGASWGSWNVSDFTADGIYIEGTFSYRTA